MRSLRLLFLAVAIAALGMAFVPASTAQAVESGAGALIADQQKALEEITARVDQLERQIDQDRGNDEKLVHIRLQLEDLTRQVLHTAVAFRPRLAEINTRLEQLGTPPPEDQPPEPDIVTSERAALTAEKASINAVISMAETLSVRVNALINLIATTRSELFRNLLTKRYELNTAFTSKVISDAREEFHEFGTAISSWLGFAFRFKFQSVVFATMMALIAAFVILFGGRRLFRQLIHSQGQAENPSYLSRLSRAFWSTLLPTLALAVFLGATYFFYDYYGVLRGDIGVYMRAAMVVVGLVFLVNRLAYGALSPNEPQWRLIPVEPGAGRWLSRLATAMAAVIGVDGFLTTITDQMASPLSLTVARGCISTIIVGILLILMGSLRPFRTATGEWRRWPIWLRCSVYVLGGFMIVAALLGYIGLALFVSLQVVVTGTILILAYIGLLAARAIGAEGGFGNSSLGRWLNANSSLEETTLDQLGLVVSIALNILIVVVFLPLILLMWGFQPGDIQAWGYRLATGMTIGNVTISITGILTGLAVFALGYFLTRWFQGWLDGSVMARGRVDAGVRNSIRLVVGYAGVAVAALVGVSAAGIDLSSLALVAGALSLGIGFGLQNVVSNFVSGLILLAERPFKVGDWIVAGDVSGTVRKISVRATEIETFQRQTVILPNSNLINGAVSNWTHRNKLGRVEIKVGVAYGTDVRRAHQVLLEIAQSHPLVLKNPEPAVQFVNFGPAALEFEIRIFLADILNGGSVQNDIRFAIIEAFDREGIEIPSTPRAVVEKKAAPWPTDDDRTEAEFAEREAAAAAARQAPKGRRSHKPDPA